VSGSSPYRLAPNCRAPVTRTVVFHPGCQVCLKMGFIWIYDRICREIANSHREIWWTMVTWWYTMVTNGVWGYPIFRQTYLVAHWALPILINSVARASA
jgi:hypothetical protein